MLINSRVPQAINEGRQRVSSLAAQFQGVKLNIIVNQHSSMSLYKRFRAIFGVEVEGSGSEDVADEEAGGEVEEEEEDDEDDDGAVCKRKKVSATN